MNRLALPMTLVLFFVAYLSQIGETLPSPKKIIEEDGSTYNEDDCEKSADEHAGSCAVIFDKHECDLPESSLSLFHTGDELPIKEGNTASLPFDFNEDVKSVIVHPGCVLFGYDEDLGSLIRTEKKDLGKGIMVSAVGKTDWVYKGLDGKFDLEDDIESLDCYCGQNAKLATQVLPLESSNFVDSIATFVGAGTAVNHCNMWIHTFNRIPTSDRPCAILFEGEDCETGTLTWHEEILPTNGIVNLPEISFGAKADSAEAVLVRPGCTFTGYDEDDGRGKKITVSAPAGRSPPKFYPLGSKYNPFGTGLKEDIDSYKCTC